MRFLSRLLLAGACAGIFAGALRATEFAWPGHGTIHFDVPDSWNLGGKPAAEVGYAFNAKPKSGAAVLQITLANTPADKPVEVAQLTPILEDVVHDFLAGSVERKFSPQPLPLVQGSGVYAQLTDSSLVGRPPQPGNFKMMRNAVAALDAHALVVITLQFDDATGPELAAMMAIVRSMRFERDPSAGRPAPRAGPVEFTMPESKLRLRIADPHLEADTERIGGGTNNPGYFKLTDRTVSRIVSGWFEPAQRYDGIQKFWRNESAGLTKNGFKPEGVEFAQNGGWEIIFYHQTLSDHSRMCHLRAELVRAGTWIDLHLSATGSEPLAELRQRLKATLAAIEISEK